MGFGTPVVQAVTDRNHAFADCAANGLGNPKIPRLGSNIARDKPKRIDGGVSQRRIMWLNSICRENLTYSIVENSTVSRKTII